MPTNTQTWNKTRITVLFKLKLDRTKALIKTWTKTTTRTKPWTKTETKTRTRTKIGTKIELKY